MSDFKRKNKLDLEYNKYSQFFNTTIIVSITILFGLLLTILTEQITIGRNASFIFVILTTLMVMVFTIHFLIKIKDKLEDIISEIDSLKL